METNTNTNQKKRGRKPFAVPEGVTVDWTQTNKQLSAVLGVSALTVFKLRQRVGAPSNNRGPKKAVVVAVSTETPTV